MNGRSTHVSLRRIAAIAAVVLPSAVRRAEPAGSPPPPLTTCRAVADHVIRAGATQPKVELEAVVIDQDASRNGIYLRDATGITVAIPARTYLDGSGRMPTIDRGERVRLKGYPYAGLRFGGVRLTDLARLGKGPPPEPRAITFDQLVAGACYHDLVAIEAVGRSLPPGDEESAALVVNLENRPVTVYVESASTRADLGRLIDSRLRIVGRASGDVNDRRQLIRAFLRVRSLADVEVLAEAPREPFALPSIPFTDIPIGGSGDGHRLKVEGIATGSAAGGIFLSAPGGGPEGQDIGMFVRPAVGANAIDIAPGDRVEAVGFPAAGAFSAFLDDAEVRVVGKAGLPPPHRLVPSSVPQENWSALNGDGERIEVDVEVGSRVDRPEATEIEAHNELAAFRIVAPPGLPAAIRPGVELHVRGLARATDVREAKDDHGKGWLVLPSRFDLFVNAANDIAYSVPWWTRRQAMAAIGWLLAACALVAAAATALAIGLRRTVTRQVKLLERKMQDEAVFEERRRIAREFHDSLEQDLAGLALRLDAAAGGVADDDARGVLERQRALVSRLQEETRQFVWDLRDPERAHWSFTDLLATQIEDQQVIVGVPIRLGIEGPPAEVPLAARHHLLRIVREAVANAGKHAQASAIDVVVAGEADGRTTVCISDDGVGFDLAACERKRGHFGIRGMRERARRIGATMAIDSRLRVGSRLTVTLCGTAAAE